MINSIYEEEIINQKIQEVLEGGEVLRIKDDRTFKLMFNNRYPDFLKWFMENLLERKIDSVIVVENNELSPINIYDKKKTVDCIVEVDKEVIIVELNNSNSGIDYTRNLLYTFHALLNKVGRSGKYKEMHGILVNMNWFTEDRSKYVNMPGVVEIHYPYPKIGYEKEKDIITVKNINLSFYSKMRYNGVKMKDFLWKLFTINKIEELHDIKENIQELSAYCKELERLSHDKEYCMMIWSEEIEKNLQEMKAYNIGYDEGEDKGIQQGIQEGIEKGIQEGIEKNRQEMVINMHNKNIPLETIGECANLSISEVEKIIENNK